MELQRHKSATRLPKLHGGQAQRKLNRITKADKQKKLCQYTEENKDYLNRHW
jgi:hypothetical protein